MTLGTWLCNLKNKTSSTAVLFKSERKWHEITWPEYLNKIIATAQHLNASGLKKKMHVGLMASTRWEWAVTDLAILGSHAVCVPLYPNLSDEDLIFTINQSEIEILVAETNEHQKQITRIESSFTKKVKIIFFNEINFDTPISNDMKEHFLNDCQTLKPKDMATIVYTSGTTGQPKGAVLLHEAIVSEVTESFDLFGVKPSYRSLTFLPFAHVLGRIEHWGSLYNGHTLAYAESIDKLKSNLLEIKPDFMIAVPRIFEKFYSAVMSQVETQPLKQKIFSSALETSKKIQYYRNTRQPIPWSLLLKHESLNRIAFAPIKNAFGGNLKFAISGGAPLGEQLADFFSSCEINILEGYGLTETCAAITVNHLIDNQPGTVGKPIGDVQIRFAADNEILVKSKKCLTEYYKNPEATAESIKDGFFSTGDIGLLTEGGFLKITDRKKDLIKTAGGKYVAPQKLEGLMKADPLISHILIHGDQKKFISALISIDEIQIKSWAESQQIIYNDLIELYQNPALRVRIQKLIQSVNAHLASYESIKKFEIVVDQWTVENGCLTQSLKVKRKFIEKKYADLIDEMYE